MSFIIFLSILLASALSSIKVNRGVTLKTPANIHKTLSSDLVEVLKDSALKDITIEDYHGSGVQSLSIMNIAFDNYSFAITNPQASCKDNTFTTDTSANDAILNYSADVQIKQGPSDLSGNMTFVISSKPIHLVITWDMDDKTNKLTKTVDFSTEFEVTALLVSDAISQEKDFIESNLKDHLTDKKVYDQIVQKIKDTTKDYYSKHPDTDVLIPIVSHAAKPVTLTLDLTDTKKPLALQDKDSKCVGMMFYPNGDFKDAKQTDIEPFDFTDFSGFGPTELDTSTYLHESVFIDFFNLANPDWNTNGVLDSSSDIDGLPFDFNMIYLSNLMPSIKNDFLLSDKLSVKYAFYNPQLTFKTDIAGTAKLDVTFEKSNGDKKQLLSFSADVSFTLGAQLDDVKAKASVVFKDVKLVNGIQLRDTWGVVAYDELVSWINIALETKLNSFEIIDGLQGVKAVELKYYEKGVRIGVLNATA
jgi:hypothetical protein